jgi:hypothetical protein
MRSLFLLVVILGALVGALVGAGFLIPREHIASSSIALKQPPDTVWEVVRHLGEVSAWWDNVSESAIVPDDAEGREVWQYSMQDGSTMLLVVDRAEAPRRLVTRIEAPPNAAFGGSWIYEIASDGAGSRLTVTEEGWIANPIFRVLAKTVFGYHRTLDSYLVALGRRLGEIATPVHEL